MILKLNFQKYLDYSHSKFLLDNQCQWFVISKSCCIIQFNSHHTLSEMIKKRNKKKEETSNDFLTYAPRKKSVAKQRKKRYEQVQCWLKAFYRWQAEQVLSENARWGEWQGFLRWRWSNQADWDVTKKKVLGNFSGDQA